MAENSGIGWTKHTFNPWIGCTKVAAECDNCYAERDFGNRFGVPWGKGQPRRRTKPGNWQKVRAWNREAERTGERVRVFCASLADVFDPEVPDELRMELFGLISATPALDWLLLTKRPRVAHDFLTEAARQGQHWLAQMEGARPECWPFRNVTLGVSAGTQRAAEVGIPWLMDTPVHHRFVSAEPLLEELDLSAWLEPNGVNTTLGLGNPGIDWLIVGGESGPNARTIHPDWVRKLCLQAQAAGTAFFFKQWGEWAPWVAGDGVFDPKATDGYSMARVGTKAAGNLLDGRSWEQLPPHLTTGGL